jgi:hypothetical protein
VDHKVVVSPGMELTPAQAATFALAHESLVSTLKADGLVMDYSLESLKDLETLFGALRELREQEPDRFEAVAPGFCFRAGAYVAEVLRRAAPGADLEMVNDELTVAMPSRVVPGGRVKVLPLVRVAKLLREEETLHGWAVVFLTMAGQLAIDTGGRGNA